ncbi:MAG: hypothetical protein M1833_006148 [Piccolia ochrophora]|nr:MAG: hypothetical protein M1833_006148 [Piccolia ochrophora]
MALYEFLTKAACVFNNLDPDTFIKLRDVQFYGEENGSLAYSFPLDSTISLPRSECPWSNLEDTLTETEANWLMNCPEADLDEMLEDTLARWAALWDPQADVDTTRQGFSRPSNKSNNQKSTSSPSPSPTQSQGSGLNAPSVPPLPSSPSLISSFSGSEGYSGNHGESAGVSNAAQPLFLNDKVQRFIVQGNFMTLAARPISVDLGEWLAHQIFEQYRLLKNFVDVIQMNPGNLPPGVEIACTPNTCPTMWAGNTTYTWLDRATGQIRTLTAPQYIALVQSWIAKKILDATTFPTEPISFSQPNTFMSGGLDTPSANTPIAAGPTKLSSSLSTLAGRDWVGKAIGFPENFFTDCQAIYKQMYRVYSHLYWAHFEKPFYHMDLERSLNSAFMHFVTVGTEFDLLSSKDLEPMQALLDKWVAMGVIPKESKLASTTAGAGSGHGMGNSSGGHHMG